MRLVGVVTGRDPRPTLPEEIPALVEFDLQTRQTRVFGRLVDEVSGEPIAKVSLLADHLCDASEDLLLDSGVVSGHWSPSWDCRGVTGGQSAAWTVEAVSPCRLSRMLAGTGISQMTTVAAAVACAGGHEPENTRSRN